MNTSKPSLSARFAMEPITSSASNPFTMRTGRSSAWQSSHNGSSESMISCGVSDLVPLYSGNISCLNVPPGGSKAIAIWVGFSLSISSRIYLVNPKRMDMSAPFELIMG